MGFSIMLLGLIILLGIVVVIVVAGVALFTGKTRGGVVNACPECGRGLIPGAESCPNCNWKR